MEVEKFFRKALNWNRREKQWASTSSKIDVEIEYASYRNLRQVGRKWYKKLCTVDIIRYLRDILKRFGMSDCKLVSTRLNVNGKLNK